MKTRPRPCLINCTSWMWPKDDGPCSCGANLAPKLLPDEKQWSPYRYGLKERETV